jgi:hypothetical protein
MSLLPGRKSDHASPGTRPSVCHTVANWPSAWISPISTGFVRWWFGSILAMPPVMFGTSMPIMASVTLSTSVVPAFSTAFTHMLKPMTCASIGSLVTRLGFLMKVFHCSMNAAFSGVSTLMK